MNSTNYRNKVFVFISTHRGINLTEKDFLIFDITWREVVDRIWKIKSTECELRQQFISYYERKYGMSVQGEILIQDLSDKDEIRRFELNSYRRKKINTAPLYFSPYFTRTGQSVREGIISISRILGIVTIANIKWEKVKNDCASFVETAYQNDSDKRKQLLSKWKKSINILKENDKDITFTYFFLDDPIKINKPILKSEKSKNWIHRMIPKNRCVSFSEFIKRMQS